MAKNDTATPDATPDATPEENPKPVLDLAKLETESDAEFTSAEKHVPQEVKDFVERAYKVWQDTPKKWRQITLGSEDAVREVVKLARLHCRRTERTFRVKDTGAPGTLVFKVTDPPKSADDSAPVADTDGGSPDGE